MFYAMNDRARSLEADDADDADGDTDRWPRLLVWRQWPVVLVACLGIALSALGYYVIESWEQEKAQSGFRQRAAEVAALVQYSVDQTVDLLYAVRDLYGVTDNVDREAFRGFTQSMLARHPQIQALEWVPRVPDASRARFEEAARKDGHAGFQFTERSEQGEIVPAEQRSEYYPAYFVEPVKGNELALGFDLGSNIRRQAALALARDSGKAIATARITLVQESGEQQGFLVFVPIYRTGAAQNTVADRRANLLGFSLGVFRIGTLIETALDHFLTPIGIDLYVLDASSNAEDRFLYSHSSPLRDAPAKPLPREEFLTGLYATKLIQVSGRTWGILFKPATDQFTSGRWLGLGALGAGLLLTALLATYISSVLGRTRQIERMVSERTEELTNLNEALTRSNRDLEEFAFVASHDLQEPLRKVQAFGDRLKRLCGDDLGADRRRRVGWKSAPCPKSRRTRIRFASSFKT
jgi:CHASE1-domain containing sensor protein